jgi:hypothetical protein
MGLILLNAVSSWFMLGVIWFVQVVHYPLFTRVGLEGFAGYEKAHARLTTFVVAPAMLIELFTAILLVVLRPGGVKPVLLWAGLALVAVAWASTWALQVPQHEVLANGYSGEAVRRLVTSNWIRTAAWTLRAGIVTAILVQGTGARV